MIHSDRQFKCEIYQEVDMVSTEMVCNPDQFRRMDVSVVFFSAGNALLVPWPEEQSRLLAPIRPFDSTVL